MKIRYAKDYYIFDEIAFANIHKFNLVTNMYLVDKPNDTCEVLIYYHQNLDTDKLKEIKKLGCNIQMLNHKTQTFTQELITVENVYKYKPEPNDVIIYIGRGRLPEIAHIHGNCGNPFTVKDYGRGFALNKYIESKPDLSHLVEIVKPYFRKQRIVLLCWCKPNPCHGDYIKQQLLENLL